MIKRHPIPIDIEDRLSWLAQKVEQRDEVVFAYLFGSLAGGKRRPLSDVDIALYLKKEALGAETKLELIGLLSDTLETDEVDLVILNRAPISLVGRILRKRQVLVDKDPPLRHRFESYRLREFFDFSRKEEAILRQRFA